MDQLKAKTWFRSEKKLLNLPVFRIRFILMRIRTRRSASVITRAGEPEPEPLEKKNEEPEPLGKKSGAGAGAVKISRLLSPVRR